MELQDKTSQNGYGWFFVDFPLKKRQGVCSGSLIGDLLRFSLRLIEMYLLFFLSMKEQVINSLRPVGK